MSLLGAAGRPGKGRTALVRGLLLFVAALIAVAGVSIWAFGHGRPTPVSASGASMAFQVYADKAKSDLRCDVGDLGRKCEILTGTAFSLDILASVPPAVGYTAYQVVVQYSSNLALQQQPGFDEHVPGDCGPLGSETKSTGRYSLSCKMGGRTTYSGPLVNVQFVCDPLGGSGQIDLIGGQGANVSAYVSPSPSGSMVFLKSEDKDGKQVADSVTINCVHPTLTPTPTSTFTPTFTPTRTRTITPTPTRTPTPTVTLTPTPTVTEASGKVTMSLRVYKDKARSGLVCDKGSIHRKCNLQAGTGFAIEVVANRPPAEGYTAYQIVLQYSGNVTLQQQPGFSEHLYGNCNLGTEQKDPGRYILTCKMDQQTTYNGPLASVQFVCGAQGGAAQIDLVGGAAANVSYYIRPSIYGSTVFLKSQDKGGKQVADSVLVNCLTDYDGDGCPNARETGNDPMLGGQRDPKNPWDFFDTNGDRHIDLFNDILGVISHWSPGGGPPYDPNFDRGPSAGPNLWNMTAPDGVIDLFNDTLGIISQFNHDCR